jgi:hypothetical protein
MARQETRSERPFSFTIAEFYQGRVEPRKQGNAMSRTTEAEVSLEAWRTVFTPLALLQIIALAKTHGGQTSPLILTALGTEPESDEKTYGLYVIRIEETAGNGEPKETLLCVTPNRENNRPEALPSILIFLASDSDHLALRCKMTRHEALPNHWWFHILDGSEWKKVGIISNPVR